MLQENLGGELVEVLCINGADVNCKNLYGHTPLHIGCSFGYTEVIKKIIEYNADINILSNDKLSPLHFLAKGIDCRLGHENPPQYIDERYVASLQLFLKLGIDVSLSDKNGQTSLHYIAQGHKYIHGCFSTVEYVSSLNFIKYLIDYGSKPTNVDNYGQTSIEIAEKYHTKTEHFSSYGSKETEIINFLKTYHPKKIIQNKHKSIKSNNHHFNTASNINTIHVDYKHNISNFKSKLNLDLFLAEIEERDINYLVHFTTLTNLKKILSSRHLFPRRMLIEQDIEYISNDNQRHDGYNYLNLSIMHPNTFLLDFYKKKNLENNDIWIILKINKKFIYQYDTMFSITNAANTYNQNIIGITPDYEKFLMLFSAEIRYLAQKEERIVKRTFNLNKKYPTDIQAEVLVSCSIPSSDILEICCKNEEDFLHVKNNLPNLESTKLAIEAKLFTSNRI